MTHVIDPAVRDWWLAESDRTSRELGARLTAWRRGWQACETAHGNAYEEGFADGCLALKRAQHETVTALRTEQVRWELRGEPRTRETFAQPFPGEYTGGPVPAW